MVNHGKHIFINNEYETIKKHFYLLNDEKRFYKKLIKDLHNQLNGNRRYCSDECSYLERLEREKENNSIKKNALGEINRVQALLRACHNQYGNRLVDVNILREQRMNWSIISGTTQIDGFEYRIIGSFAYTVFEKSKIQIIKL